MSKIGFNTLDLTYIYIYIRGWYDFGTAGGKTKLFLFIIYKLWFIYKLSLSLSLYIYIYILVVGRYRR